MSTFDKVFLFRISSSFSVLGVSLICFLLGGLSKERSNALFSLLHSFCAGIMLGMGFLFDDPDGIAHMNHESTHSAVYIASVSFIAMLAVEHFNATSSYDYAAVVTLDDEERDFDRHNRQIELTGVGNRIIRDDDEEDGLDEFGLPPERGEQSLTAQMTSKSFKFHPLILLFFASASDMVGGIHLSCEEHYGMHLLFVVLIHKALMSCAFGTLLESSTAPRSMFLYFMLTYGFSSTLGILTGTLMSKFGFVTPQLLRSMRGTDLVVTALTAGVYLFIAAMKMIPAGLTNESPSSALEKSEQRTRGREKTVKFVLFVAGFLAAVLPKLLVQ